jgi:hypothetical protein
VGISYAAAITLFATPLALMEVSGLSETSAHAVQSILTAYKPHQEMILGGHILPIGEEPSGAAWTGFQSIIGKDAGYIILFREYCEAPHAELQLHDVEQVEELSFEYIVGSSNTAVIEATACGTKVVCSLPQEHSFALYAYKRRFNQ